MRLILLAALVSAYQEARVPPPDPAACKESEKLVREVFKDDYAKKSPVDRANLARKLLDQGIQTRDDRTSQYVLFQEARLMAAEAGDTATTLRAIDEICLRFEVDAFALKLAALSTTTARSAGDWTVTSEALLKLSDDALGVLNFDGAEKAAKAATTAARNGKNVTLAVRAESKSKEIGDMKAKSAKVKAAADLLASNPEDPEANLVAGRFLCFVQENWTQGLSHLAKGADAALKAQAEKDLEKPSDASEQAAVADGWWDLAEKEKGLEQAKIRRRAGFWYSKALPKLTGLTKVKVEKRVGSLPKSTNPESAPGLLGWWKFDEGSGTEAGDSTDQKHSGTFYGKVDWVDGKAGKALRFDGSSAHVKIPGITLETNAVTVACWVRHDLPTYQRIERYITIGQDAVVLRRDRPGFHFYIKTDNQLRQLFAGSLLKGSQWHHVAGTWNGKQQKLYVDGKTVATGQPSGTLLHGTGVLLTTTQETLQGDLDDVRIYDRALTDAEISALAASK